MFLIHEYDLKTKPWSTEAPKSKKGEIVSSYVSILLNKKSKSKIFTPKFKSIESIWIVLAGSCKKNRTNQNCDFFAR